MLPVDFHCHSFLSNCGLHSHLELLTRARDLGMTALAITDHGTEGGGRLVGGFFQRLHEPLPGIRLLKGVEANPRGLDGDSDLPLHHLPTMDIVLFGLHGTIPRNLGHDRNTDIVIAAMSAQPAIDIIAHPTATEFPLDFPRLARAAAAQGVALEVNNSKLHLQRIPEDMMHALLRACIAADCRVTINSDAHAINEVGRDIEARAALAAVDFPSELIINDTPERALAFVAERRPAKLAAST